MAVPMSLFHEIVDCVPSELSLLDQLFKQQHVVSCGLSKLDHILSTHTGRCEPSGLAAHLLERVKTHCHDFSNGQVVCHEQCGMMRDKAGTKD